MNHLKMIHMNCESPFLVLNKKYPKISSVNLCIGSLSVEFPYRLGMCIFYIGRVAQNQWVIFQQRNHYLLLAFEISADDNLLLKLVHLS